MTVLFLGPLPPPVHGFSVINQAMLSRLQAKTEVVVFNRSPKALEESGPRTRIAKFWAWWSLVRRFHQAASKRPESLYAGLSGGAGQLLDLPFLLLARWHGVPITVHHHSYAYLNRHSRLTAAVFHAMGVAQHIVLCDDMKVRLSNQYDVATSNIQVLSNAAFMDEYNAATAPENEIQNTFNKVTFGFLSNITVEKGIFDFFEVLDKTRENNFNITARVAGPVAVDIHDRFHAALHARPWVEYVGPVYGEHKDRFLSSIDVLLFPTRYANEAEPVTILEALRVGTAVVAARRGCISSMLGDRDHCGECTIDQLDVRVAEQVNLLVGQDAESRKRIRQDIATHYQKDAKKAQAQLQAIVQRLISP